MLSSVKLGHKLLSTNLGFFSPYELNFAITYKCNSRCKTCGVWKLKPRDEMSLEEIEKFSKKISFINWIRLTGGEPFLRKNYVDIVRTLDKNLDLFLLTTPTNGISSKLIYSNVSRVLKFFKKRYIITISLDGPQKVHNKIRGVRCWNKAIETYKLLNRLQKDKRNFKLFFGYTISPYNAGHFKETVESVKQVLPEIDVKDFHLNLFQTSDVYYHNRSWKLDEKYKRNALKDIDYFTNSQSSFLDSIKLVEFRYLRLAKGYLKSGKMPIPCNVFNLSSFIDPSGNVYPCTMFDRKLGSLRENGYDLKKILTSEKAKKLAEEIKNGRCPHCWTPCEAHQVILSSWFKTVLNS